MVGLFSIFTRVWTFNLKTRFYRINQNILIKCHFYILYAVEIDILSIFALEYSMKMVKCSFCVGSC